MTNERTDKEVRKITTVSKGRIETGALQVNKDWPGLFVRGDDCLMLRSILRKAYRAHILTAPEEWKIAELVAAIDFDVTET